MKKRLHFRPSHRDKAERHIITAGMSVGATVHQLNGKDIPDLCVGFRGLTFLAEVKSRILTEDKGRKPRMRTTRVSEGQKTFAEKWRGGPTGIVYEPADLLRMIGAPFVAETEGPRWLAENGAFLCEQCWCPENGLHAKDCPTRKALARPPKVETAHSAAKRARDLLPEQLASLEAAIAVVSKGPPPGMSPCVVPGCGASVQPVGDYFCPRHEDRQSRGVAGELQPLKEGKHAKDKRKDQFDDHWQVGR